MENNQIISLEQEPQADVSMGFAALNILFHHPKYAEATVKIEQKDINSTCFKNPEILSEYSFTATKQHPIVHNKEWSPIKDQVKEELLYKLYVKKGFKYEVTVTFISGNSSSCITVSDAKDEIFQQFF